MWKRRPLHAIVAWAIAFVAVAGFVFESSSLGETNERGDYGDGQPGPTAVAGESWLSHLHRSFDETSMGKTGRLGPPPAAPEAEPAGWRMGFAPEPANEGVTLHGSDLYRMNCQGCHGEEGRGAPPEINSVINPVRATSAATVMERMKVAGMEISRADAGKLARQSKALLLERLHHGGQDMPAFPQLGEAEVNSLVAYLRQLAGVRGAEAEQIGVRERREQVGEYIVKSTCHVCHSAAGANPNAQQLYEGAIPPLNTLALRTSRAEFIRKVTHGAPVMMGAPPELYRGRMPVFYYLSEEEAADVYLYLARYPPYQWAILDPAVAASAPDERAGERGRQVIGASLAANEGLAEGRPARTETDGKALAALWALVAIAFLGLGLGFTVWEMKRLAAANEGRSDAAARVSKGAGADDEGEEHGKEPVDCESVA
jgi:mono/diheme cytochrome c family protein